MPVVIDLLDSKRFEDPYKGWESIRLLFGTSWMFTGRRAGW